jgi:hypothetical protein
MRAFASTKVRCCVCVWGCCAVVMFCL